MAFAVTWDSLALHSLQENLDSLDVVIPEWLKLTTDGKIKPPTLTPPQQEFSRLLRAAPNGPKLVPLLANSEARGRLGNDTGRLLASGTSRNGIGDELLQYAQSFPVDGFCLDFQGLPPEQLPNYACFIEELAPRLHAAHKVLYVCASLEFPPWLSRRLAQAADLLIVTAFGQHAESGGPGPLAAQDWYEDLLRRWVEEIPPARLGIAFGNYACDWTEHSAGGVLASVDHAMARAHEQQAIVRLDPASLNPAFRYKDAKGQAHNVWFLDAVTACNQLAAARKFRPRALALWRLGREDASLWRFYGQAAAPDEPVCQMLADMIPNGGIDYAGAGEIMRIAVAPEIGRRRLVFDERRALITACDYEQLPTPYVVRRYGAAPAKIALTFDDVPEPAYTPAILEILRRERAPATFFVIGKNAELYPELVKRMDREGHEIGNHTFTHPNVSRIAPRQIELELAATQRLLEGLLGRQTLLFRPPYGEDIEPLTTNDVQMLEVVNKLGYWIVGMHVDPLDWRSPPAEAIVQCTLAQIKEGRGNIVLLHAGGGQREQTVRALPQLIATLRQHGYQLVTVSELLGCRRDDVMPPLTGARRVLARLNQLAFGLLGAIIKLLNFLFGLGIALGLARLLFIGTLAVVDARRKRRLSWPDIPQLSVAVIVPAYNEEQVICQTIRSLLNSQCPCPLEIVVVDDGSQDGTYERARMEFGGHPAVLIFRKTNGGKAAALNFGISQTNADIIVAIDADTVFAPDTIWKLVRHFARPDIGAVAGNAKVGNRINVLTKWQALEYITSQNLDRRAFNVMNCITVVPGAVGAWRRELLLKTGGFTRATLAEDADLTMAIRRLGYSIVNEDEACAYTEAPVTLGGFVRQRYRWMFGTLQAAWRHKGALFNPRYGAMGFVALPNILIFQVFFPLISPVMDLLTVCALGQFAWDTTHGATGSGQALAVILAFYALFVMFDFGTALLALALEPKEDKRLLWWVYPQRFCYRQLMYYVAIKSTFAALRGMEVGWNKLKRTATVKVPAPPPA